MKFEQVISTAGKGLWSGKRKRVSVNSMRIAYLDDQQVPTFGELRVYFDTKTWDVERDNIIYTDPLWIVELRLALRQVGFTDDALESGQLNYSEAGMQGDDYVSLDIGDKFIRQYKTMEQP